MTDWHCIRRDVETEAQRNWLLRECAALRELVDSRGRELWSLYGEKRILQKRLSAALGSAEAAERMLEKARGQCSS